MGHTEAVLPCSTTSRRKARKKLPVVRQPGISNILNPYLVGMDAMVVHGNRLGQTCLRPNCISDFLQQLPMKNILDSSNSSDSQPKNAFQSILNGEVGFIRLNLNRYPRLRKSLRKIRVSSCGRSSCFHTMKIVSL